MNDIKKVFDTDLKPNERERFGEIFDGFYSIQDGQNIRYYETTYTNLNNRIIQSFEEYPVLAKTVSKQMLGWSLLQVIADKCSYPQVHPAIKLLIEKNPSALLWTLGTNNPEDDRELSFEDWVNLDLEEDVPISPIMSIADSICHVKLMPWIAENFPFVFESQAGDDEYPHFRMFDSALGDTSIIQRFYETFPKGLRQHDVFEGLPIHVYLSGPLGEPDLGIAKLMADGHPEGLLSTSESGLTPLHRACLAFMVHRTHTMADICIYLASKCPESVQVKTGHGEGDLPVQMLTRFCNRPPAQRVLLTFLRLYPEAINAPKTGWSKAPAKVPFLRDAHRLVVEEQALKSEMNDLVGSSAAWHAAAKLSKDEPQASACDAFDMWSDLRRTRFQERLDDIPRLIAEVCQKYEGEDRGIDHDMMDFEEDDEDVDMDDQE